MKRKIQAVYMLMFCVLALPPTGSAEGLITTASGGIALTQFEIPCVVSLSKGKTLAIRNENGKRLRSTLANGTKVTAVNMADGDPSGGVAQIAVTRKGKRVVLGWVKQAELSCKFN